MTGLTIALALVAAYLLGATPSAYIVGRLRKGIDIRQVGSRNMGAMNVFYNVGFGWGALVLAMDIGKGAVAMALALALDIPEVARFAAGFVAVLGHSFPVFLRFRGGKGGAVCIGVLFVTMPWGIPVGLGIFGLALLITRFPTFSYSLALAAFPFVGWLVYDRWQLVVFSVVLMLVPVIRYLPRVREMHTTAGNWRHFLRRRSLSDRL